MLDYTNFTNAGSEKLEKQSNTSAVYKSRRRLLVHLRVKLLRPLLALSFCLFVAFLLLRSSRDGPESWAAVNRSEDGSIKICIVTAMLDNDWEKGFATTNSQGEVIKVDLNDIAEQKRQYAERYSFDFYVKNFSESALGGAHFTWAKMPTLQDAMKKFPDTDIFWYLDRYSIILNPSVNIVDYILQDSLLNKVLLRNYPVIPSTTIKTPKKIDPSNIKMLLGRDESGLHTESLIVRRSKWSDYILSFWNDPHYRYFPFERMDQEAMEHMIQWHYTVLKRIGLIDAKYLSVRVNDKNVPPQTFVAIPSSCLRNPSEKCAPELMYDFILLSHD